MNTEEEHGDGPGTQPVATSSGGDLSEKRDHNYEQVLDPPVNEDRVRNQLVQLIQAFLIYYT